MSSPMVVLITGASRGIGRALAAELSKRGHKVYGAGRTWPAGEERLPFTALSMDVKDEVSVKTAVERVAGEAGRIDVLVNNAGISHCGAIEDTPLETARRIFETNYVGLARTIRAVLPLMRRQGMGVIANVGSAAGKIGIPFQAHYAASKFAVEGLTEALYHEVKGFGVRVLLIEPGDVGTEIWKRSEQCLPEDSAYAESMSCFQKVKAKEMGKAADPPENVARQIADVIESGGTRLRHPVAKGAGLFLFARKILPDRLFLWAVAKNYRIGPKKGRPSGT